MLNIVEKYVSFDAPENAHMKAKIKNCRTILDLQKVFINEKWIISSILLSKINNELKRVKYIK